MTNYNPETLTAKAIVARGRTVVSGGKDYGPGEEIELPMHEIERLRHTGFLVDPNKLVVIVNNGTVGPVSNPALPHLGSAPRF
ncbi:hypothetical protein GAY33_03245 [Azospirillum brasilense]|uniref:hypothetical protein n=1 Tax=Azospirillum argentinense TaxID=2970906 RepID=UPI00190C048D|nr:hypothetical protein [Azospirillum argentinense]MBK3798264.1 hypothetical protein [Azospirillum argentinense]